MAELETPRRWLEEGTADLPRELLDGLHDCAQSGPSRAQQLRMQESLLRGIASAAPAASGALLKLGLLSLVAGCTLGALWWWRDARTPGPAPASALSAAAGGEPAPEAEPAAAAPEPAAPAPALERATTREHRAAVRSMRPKSGGRAATTALREDAAGELELLTRARRALGSAPERSLELAAEHARTYGEGTFAQERELLGIEALVKLGRMEEARRRAARFAVRYRDSAHLPRLDVLVGPQ
jgi:hypothetical protein